MRLRYQNFLGIEERIQGLKEIGKLEWIYHVQLTGPSHIAFSERALPSLDYRNYIGERNIYIFKIQEYL